MQVLWCDLGAVNVGRGGCTCGRSAPHAQACPLLVRAATCSESAMPVVAASDRVRSVGRSMIMREQAGKVGHCWTLHCLHGAVVVHADALRCGSAGEWREAERGRRQLWEQRESVF